MTYKSDDFTYHIMASRSSYHRHELALRNKIFSAWYELWDQVYRSSGSEFKLNSDEFIRQDFVTSILYKNEVAAVHLYSFFDLDCNACQLSKYFQFFNRDYFETLKHKRVSNVMSMEFLTVLPQYRKSQLGFSLGQVITQLGTYLFKLTPVQAIVAPVRLDVKAHEIAYDLGFDCIQAGTIQRGFPCDLIACFRDKQRESSHFQVNQLARPLWGSRTVHDSAQLLFDQWNSLSNPVIQRAA